MVKDLKIIVNNLKQKTLEYKKENPSKFYSLAAILIAGAFLRLYRISEHMTFLGDEGRDAIVVRRLIVEFDPILVGPGTSIGDMYLGPLYYYMMAPALFFANLSPEGPAIMVAILGVITIAFVWYVAREWFSSDKASGEIAGLVAASLYAVSPVIIRYSQSSWNPNIMPFFALLSIYSTWRVWQYLEFKWLIVTGVSIAFVLQSHYIGLLLLPVVGFFWLLTLIKNKLESKDVGGFFKRSFQGLAVFLFLMSPLVIFDARHGWRNFEAMKIFFTQRQTTISARPWTAIPDMFSNLKEILTVIVGAGNETIGSLIAYAFILALIVFVLNFFKNAFSKSKKDKKFLLKLLKLSSAKRNAAYSILFVWLIIGLLGLGVYKQHIYAHYYGFLFPVPMLLLGGISQYVWNRNIGFNKLVLGLTIIFLVIINLSDTPIKYPPNRQMQRTVEIADKIIREAGDEKYNFAVLAERNYEGAYQYFLEREKSPLVMIDPQRAEESIAEQLFVVCELPENECDPVHSDKTEIANFGWSKVDEKWYVAGVTLYKLVHNK